MSAGRRRPAGERRSSLGSGRAGKGTTTSGGRSAAAAPTGSGARCWRRGAVAPITEWRTACTYWSGGDDDDGECGRAVGHGVSVDGRRRLTRTASDLLERDLLTERDSATAGGRLGRRLSALERWIRFPALIVEIARPRGVRLRAVLADTIEHCWRLGPPALARRKEVTAKADPWLVSDSVCGVWVRESVELPRPELSNTILKCVNFVE
ncbi:hypothetical protein M6B38_328950 [Iris pallida]|uniref:Uncharacterized protein n=1 Tax=Iris pallida TaxID=29817 RepID=A0AAX6H666_IRIPA|nr:hypothetical protein M6B38_328950 [Iris pallida]